MSLKSKRRNSKSSLCNPQLGDPLTRIISFMPNPGPFRACCTATMSMWDRAVYYEGELPCLYVVSPSTSTTTSSTTPTGGVAVGATSAVVGSLPYSFPVLPQQVQFCPHELRWFNDPGLITNGNNNSMKDFPMESIHFERLPGMISVGDCWLHTATALKTATFKDLPQLETVGGNWLRECSSLESVHFEQMPKLKTVGYGWLDSCTALKTATFKDLPELEEVSGCWMYGCTSLESLHFEQLPKLKTVGDDWLCGCTALKTATFKDLPELEEVRDSWLRECSSLESVHFEQMPKLKTVCDDMGGWLAGCTALKTATFKDLPQLETVGGNWLCECSSLESVHFEQLPKLTTLGDSWLLEVADKCLRGCTALKSIQLEGEIHPTLKEFARDSLRTRKTMTQEQYKAKGNEAFKAKNHSEAIDWYSKAIDVDPDVEAAGALYSNRAASYMAVNKFEQAVTDGDNCIRVRPNWLKGHFRKGVALESLGRLDEALKAFDGSLATEPNNEEIQEKVNTLRLEINDRNQKTPTDQAKM